MAFDAEALATGLGLDSEFVGDTLSHHRVDGAQTDALTPHDVTESVAMIVQARVPVSGLAHGLNALRRAVGSEGRPLTDRDRVLVAAFLSEVAGRIEFSLNLSAARAGEVE